MPTNVGIMNILYQCIYYSRDGLVVLMLGVRGIMEGICVQMPVDYIIHTNVHKLSHALWQIKCNKCTPL